MSLFLQKETKVTFLLPSVIILGEDGEVYMLGPRIPVHRRTSMLLRYTIEMKVVATFSQVFSLNPEFTCLI